MPTVCDSIAEAVRMSRGVKSSINRISSSAIRYPTYINGGSSFRTMEENSKPESRLFGLPDNSKSNVVSPAGSSDHEAFFPETPRPEPNQMCPMCLRECSSERSLFQHLFTTHTQLDMYICIICDTQRFSRPQDLSEHIQRFHSNQLIQCSFCGAVLCSYLELERHILLDHPSVKPYKCCFCKESFTVEESLKSHILYEIYPVLKCALRERTTSSVITTADILSRLTSRSSEGPQPSGNVLGEGNDDEDLFSSFDDSVSFVRVLLRPPCPRTEGQGQGEGSKGEGNGQLDFLSDGLMLAPVGVSSRAPNFLVPNPSCRLDPDQKQEAFLRENPDKYLDLDRQAGDGGTSDDSDVGEDVEVDSSDVDLGSEEDVSDDEPRAAATSGSGVVVPALEIEQSQEYCDRVLSENSSLSVVEISEKGGEFFGGASPLEIGFSRQEREALSADVHNDCVTLCSRCGLQFIDDFEFAVHPCLDD